MTDTSYTFLLYRPRETWRDFEVTYKGETIAYRGGMECGTAMLAHRLKERGLPDGPVIVQEIRVKPEHALRQEGSTLYSLAAYYEEWRSGVKRQPVVAAPAEEPVAAEAPKANGKAVDPATVTILRFKGRVITIPQRQAVRLLLEDKGAWHELHAKTKRTVAEQGWVTDPENPELTDDGRDLLRHMGLPA